MLVQSTLILIVHLMKGLDSTQWPLFPLRNVMRSIDLGKSGDIYLPTGTCQANNNNEITLNLPNTGLVKLYPGIIQSDYVTCITLRENMIDHVLPGTFDCLPRLKYLDLSKNRIPYCDILSIGSNSLLKTLILDENEAPGKDFGYNIEQADRFANLEHLYLRKNHLRVLKFTLDHSFPRLTHLYLSDNLIESDEVIKNPPQTLTHLYLERNQIVRFGNERIMDRLKYLYLDNNRITSLCSSNQIFYCRDRDNSLDLRGAGQLQYLSLTNNNLMNIEIGAFKESCGLTSLKLSRNTLDIILPGTFDCLTGLKDLSLDRNRLKVIPDLNSNGRLTNLELSYNEIEFIPSRTFCYLRHLKWLSLRNNRIQRIDAEAFLDLISLEELDLADNKLDRLQPRWFVSQMNLKKLDLRGNRFTNIQHFYLDVPNNCLEHVYLQYNCIEYVKPRDFVALGNAVMVHLENQCQRSNLLL